MLQTSDNVCLGYFLHVLLVLVFLFPILSPERQKEKKERVISFFSNAQDCKCYYWDFLFSALLVYWPAKCIKYGSRKRQRADFCHIKHSVLFYAFCISRSLHFLIEIPYFYQPKLMFFHLAFPSPSFSFYSLFYISMARRFEFQKKL